MARKKSTRPLGMPRNSALRRQAMQIAQSSVTPASQIRKQYGRAQNDAAGFTDALVSLLQGQQAAYNGIASDSQAQQASIDNAAVSRLGGLGDYSAGAMGATGALGTSAETRANAASTALRAFGAQQPGIAGSRGLLTKESLNNALQDALDQRRTQLHQAFLQAYPQVQQNAFSQRLALANLGMDQARLAEQQREFNVSTAQSNQHFWANLEAQYSGGTSTGKGVSKSGVASPSLLRQYGMTQTQWRSSITDSRQQAVKAANQGVGPQQFIHELITVGNVPPPIALNAVRVIYGGLKRVDPTVHPKLAQAYNEYQAWLTAQRHDKNPPRRKRGQHR